MNRLLVKSGVEQLPLFSGKGFPYFEAYLRGDEDLTDLLNTDMKLLAVHTPHLVEYQGKNVPLTLGDDEASHFSFIKLQELNQFCEDNEVPYMVVHLGFFNALKENHQEILSKVAQKLNFFKGQKTKICIENVPCWTNICFENEPIVSDYTHLKYLKRLCPALGVTLDIDHLAINTVFQHFYSVSKENYILAVDKWEFRRSMEKEISESTKKNHLFFKKEVDNAITNFLQQLLPDTVHAVGSDFCNYRQVEKLPLIGEALPLWYKGTIKGYKVEDRIDHSRWLYSLSNNTCITMELYLRPDYDYITELRGNYKKIQQLLNSKP